MAVVSPSDSFGVDERTVKRISRLVRDGRRDAVADETAAWAPRRMVMLLRQLPLGRARTLFTWLPVQRAIGVMDVVDPQAAALLAADDTLDRLAEILLGLDVDEAVDVVVQLPDSTREQLELRLPPASVLGDRLRYGDDTAGEIMSHRFVAVPSTRTVGQTVRAIQERAEVVGSVHGVFLVGEDGRLTGYLEPEDLLLHPSTDQVGRWARSDAVVVTTDTDQEDVLRLAIERDVTTLPVVDAQQRLLGGITTEELAAVLREEAHEDSNIASGLPPEAGPNDTLGQLVRHRLPWLLAGLVGSTVAGVAVGGFEDALLEAAILASFIPVVMAMAGNAGIQASQVTVSGISSGTIWAGDRTVRLLRELAGGLLNSGVVGLVLGAFIVLVAPLVDIERPAALALTALVSLVAAMTLAVTLGATVPVGLHRLGVDPAVSTGVFIAAANDIIGVSTFFVIATAIYL